MFEQAKVPGGSHKSALTCFGPLRAGGCFDYNYLLKDKCLVHIGGWGVVPTGKSDSVRFVSFVRDVRACVRAGGRGEAKLRGRE